MPTIYDTMVNAMMGLATEIFPEIDPQLAASHFRNELVKAHGLGAEAQDKLLALMEDKLGAELFKLIALNQQFTSNLMPHDTHIGQDVLLLQLAADCGALPAADRSAIRKDLANLVGLV